MNDKIISLITEEININPIRAQSFPVINDDQSIRGVVELLTIEDYWNKIVDTRHQLPICLFNDLKTHLNKTYTPGLLHPEIEKAIIGNDDAIRVLRLTGESGETHGLIIQLGSAFSKRFYFTPKVDLFGNATDGYSLGKAKLELTVLNYEKWVADNEKFAKENP